MTRPNKKEREAAIARLKEWLPEGSQVYCIVRSQSDNGSQCIQVVYFEKNDDGTLDDRHPTYSIAQALGQTCIKRGGHDTVRVTGSGFDHAESLINEHLSYTLYEKPNAFKVRTL